jgi:hypothetical protein
MRNLDDSEERPKRQTSRPQHTAERSGGTHVVWRKEFLLHYGKFAVFTTENKKVELELELET